MEGDIETYIAHFIFQPTGQPPVELLLGCCPSPYFTREMQAVREAVMIKRLSNVPSLLQTKYMY